MESLPADQEQDEIIIKCSLEEMTKAFFKDYEIIWQDPNVNSQENQQYLTKLEKLCKVKAFTEWKQAENYLNTAKTVCHVITAGTNGEFLVNEIFSSQNVPRIFSFCQDEEEHSPPSKHYEKILCTETNIEDVIAQIQKNLLRWYKQTSSLRLDLPAFAPIFDDHDKSKMNHLHYYLKVIPSFHNRAQAKNDFASLSKAVFSDKKNEELSAEFEQTYNKFDKEAILRWYTQQSFLYKMINNCLRIATSDSIQWSRFLLKDIERAIKDQYQTTSKNFSGLLFRAAYLSEQEWSNLKANVNREIEMHRFLSVSKEKKVALKFMGVDPTQKVFITIIVPKGSFEEEQGFAEIEEFSRFPKEKEVLFNVRSRFTVLDTEDKYSDDLPCRHLVLFYGAQGLRRFLTEENPVQHISIEDIGNILCSHCRISTGKMTEKVFFMALANPEKQMYSCKNCLDNSAAPFLWVLVNEKVFTTKIEGYLLMSSSQIQIPLYGYKCSKCGAKNRKRYFVCTDCGEKEKRWCEDCFGKTLSCTEMRHAIILENYPLSFWCEKMTKFELSHLKYQKDLVENNDHTFQQAKMSLEAYEYEKAVDYYLKYLGTHGENHADAAAIYGNIGLIMPSREKT